MAAVCNNYGMKIIETDENKQTEEKSDRLTPSPWTMEIKILHRDSSLIGDMVVISLSMCS